MLVTISTLIEDKTQLYHCSLVGCRYKVSRHREYVKHPRMENVICNFKHRCSRRFTTIEDLIVHIREDHSAVVAAPGSASAVKSVVIDIPVKCNMSACPSKHFSSIKQLMKHFNTHHKKDARDCVFFDCDHRFDQFSDSRKHFRSKNIEAGHTRVKAHHLLSGSNQSVQFVENQTNMNITAEVVEQFGDDNDNYDAFNINEIETGDADEESEEYFLHYYADFLNRLCHVKFIPHSTVQDIALE